MGGVSEEWQLLYDKNRRWWDFRQSVEAQQLEAEFKSRHRELEDQYKTIIALCERLLEVEAHILNDLDHQLAKQQGEPPPKKVPLRDFVGKRSRLGPSREKHYEQKLRTRKVLNRNGFWWDVVFPTVEEAEAFDREQAEKKLQKQTKKKAKQMVRMQRWLGERLGVENSD